MKKYVIVMVFMSVLSFIFQSCQKETLNSVVSEEDDIKLSVVEERFLESGYLKSGGNSEKADFVVDVIKNLEKQNKEKRFIENFVKKYGYPDWEMVRYFEGNTEIVVQIPVSKDDDCETRAIILAVKHKNKLKFKLLLRDKFEQFTNNKKPVPDTEKIKDLFIIFDFLTYGESSYLVDGKVEFGDENPENNTLKSASVFVEDYYCYTIYVRMGDYETWRWECESWYVYEPVTEEMAADNSTDGGGTSEWYLEGNGGGSGTTTSQPAPEIDYKEIVENDKAWCVFQKLIQTGTNDYNSLVLSFIASFSGNEPYRDVVFEIDNLDSAYGSFDGTVYPPIIRLDAGTISNRAPIEIAKTLMHEMFHAFIYQDASLYPSSFITNFREYLVEVEGSNDVCGKNDHQIIYDNYVIPMMNFLKDYDSLLGQTEDDEYYRGLALSGLQNDIVGFTQEELNSITQAETFFRNRGLNCN